MAAENSEGGRVEEMERRHSALRESVESMEHVLGIVGHELRTPLAGLRAMSEFLLTDGAAATAEGQGFLRSMRDELERMSGTLDTLLEAARLNSGRAAWNWSEFAIRPACEEAVESMRCLIDGSGVSLFIEVQPEDLRMRGDADAIRRLICNLVSNSLKHTHSGEIVIKASAPSPRHVRIEVHDTGEGIAPEIVEHLGEAFALNQGVIGSPHINGTGLGLAICKGIVSAHDGILSIASELGFGTSVIAMLRSDLDKPQPMPEKINLRWSERPARLGR
jgi:signal transduction histidine kinase